MLRAWLASVFLMGIASSSFAAYEAVMTAPADRVLSQKKFSENRDIADPQLRADAGSLSRYSLRANFAYYGPPVGNLEALDQPNPDGTVSVTATALTGSFGGRYRIDSKSSMSLSAGVSDQYVFHSEQRADVNNPFLSYNRAFRAWGVQMVSSPGASLITNTAYRAVGETTSLNYALSAVYNLGQSRFALGLETTLAYYFFERRYIKKDGKVRRNNIGLNPSLKYNVNDKLNVYTSIGFALFNPRASSSEWHLHSKTPTQRVGAGYAFTRDIYVTPYVSFFPEKVAFDTTTINLNTVFSVF